MTSLYPLENGMAFAQYSGNKYDDIFEIYKNADYYTMYMHGNEGNFWNRQNVYKSLKVEEMLEFIKEADHEFNNVETEINYANVVCGIIMENGTNVKQEKMLI